MISTALAIAIVFVTTLLTVPIFYPVKKRKAGAKAGGNAGGEPVAHERNVPVTDGKGATVAVKTRTAPTAPRDADASESR